MDVQHLDETLTAAPVPQPPSPINNFRGDNSFNSPWHSQNAYHNKCFSQDGRIRVWDQVDSESTFVDCDL